MARAPSQQQMWSASDSESASHSVVFDFATPWTVTHHAPLSMESSRQEYWSGLPHPFPGDPPDPEMKPGSPALQAILYRLSCQGSLSHVVVTAILQEKAV